MEQRVLYIDAISPLQDWLNQFGAKNKEVITL